MKYFYNVYIFTETFQSAMPLCPSCFFLPMGPLHIFSDAKYISLCGTRMEHHRHFFLDYPQNHYFNLGLGFGPNMWQILHRKEKGYYT